VCSQECSGSDECSGIGGASWTCSNSTGLCHVECEGADDDESCPEGLICVMATGPGAFRCKHPDDDGPGPGTKFPYETCTHSNDCADLLICHVPSGFDTGYCTLSCNPEDGSSCEHISPGGEINASCEMPFPSTGSSHCALDCEDKPDGCPHDMTCIEYAMFSRCGYPN
jgi:hypothetical protein